MQPSLRRRFGEVGSYEFAAAVTTTYAKYIGVSAVWPVALRYRRGVGDSSGDAWPTSHRPPRVRHRARRTSRPKPPRLGQPAGDVPTTEPFGTIPTSTPSKDTTTTNSSASAGDTPKNDSGSSSSETVTTPGTGVVVRELGRRSHLRWRRYHQDHRPVPLDPRPRRAKCRPNPRRTLRPRSHPTAAADNASRFAKRERTRAQRKLHLSPRVLRRRRA